MYRSTLRNRLHLLIAVLALSVLIAACGSSEAATPDNDASDDTAEAPADDDTADAGDDASDEDDTDTDGAFDGGSVSILMNWLPQAEQGGYWQAAEEDLGADDGLEIEIVSGGSGVQTIANVAVGSADYGLVGSDALLEARSQGIPVVMILGGFESPQCLMTHPEAGVEGIHDLHDSQISVTPAGTFWRWIAAEFGYEDSEVIPPADLATFFDTPDMVRQCFATSEPYTAEQEGHDIEVFMVSDVGYQPYSTGLFTTEERIEEHPEEVAAVVAVTMEGWERFLEDNTAGAEAIMEANPDMTKDRIDDSTVRIADELYADGVGVMEADRWQELYEQLDGVEVLAAEIDPLEGFTTEFMDAYLENAQ